MNIRDIAKICGVSPSTVSKILHGRDGDISATTRKRVLKAVKEYQYVPYSKVIQNVSYKSNIIGVLLQGQEYGAKELLYGIERIASDNGYSVILCNTQGDEERTFRHINVLQNKKVDGILCVYQDRNVVKDFNVPLVWIDKGRAGQGKSSGEYCYEEEEAGYLAVSHLVKKGHTKISCILRGEDAAIEAGCIRAFQEYQLLLNKELIFRGTKEEILEIGLTKYLDMGNTAVVCGEIETGYLICERLRERGVLVPENVSVISARDGSLAEEISPRLTAVHVLFDQIASEAALRLIEMIEKQEPSPAYEVKKALSIVERESVKPPMKHIQGGKIVVVGSINMDCMVNVSHIPTKGETLSSHSLQFLPGGKGANQAIGVGKLNGQVYMVGCLGNDSDGKEIYNNLVNCGVKVEGVVFDNALATGKAYVNVASDGESTIVVYPGANSRLDREQVQRFGYLLNHAKYCLLSLEIEEEIVEYTIQKCKAKDVEVILKPSVVEKVKESLLEKIDYFIPNEKEIKQLVPEPKSIEEKAERLFQKGVKNIIVTLGDKGCYLRNREYSRFFPAADFYPVDTTGGADAFISSFAVYMSEGHDIIEAIGYATYAAGICITRLGVQTALTNRTGLELYADEIRRKFVR